MRPMTRIDGANLLKRRLKKIGMVGEYSRHSFRATGITRCQKLLVPLAIWIAALISRRFDEPLTSE
jgi:hypothetical protein